MTQQRTLSSDELNRDEISDDLFNLVHTVPDAALADLLQFFATILHSDPDHLDALYGFGVVSQRQGNLDQAHYHFKRAYQRAPDHLELCNNLITTSINLNEFDDALSLAEELLPKKADDPELYGSLHYLYHLKGQRNDILKLRKQMARNCTRGYHLQIHMPFRLDEAARPTPPAPPPRKKKQPAKPANKPPKAVSGDATPVGVGGLTLNGAIGGSTLPARYFFRFGTAPGTLDNKTVERDLPPGRHGQVADTAANSFQRVYGQQYKATYKKIKNSEKPPGPKTDVSVSLLHPYGKDRNHMNGLGIVDLFLFWRSVVHIRDRLDGEYAETIYPRKVYPGELLDLRDGEFSAVLRSNDFDAKDFHLVAWIHADTGTAVVPDHMEDAAPWALTAGMENNRIIADNKWREYTFTFRDNSNDWSFSGNNVEEMGLGSSRYRYFPLSETLRRNRGNICLCFVGGNDLDTPEGEIELASLSFRYRSQSLLGPGFGGELLKAPKKASDAAALTQGWIGNEAHYWQSAANPKAAQEFTWKFAAPASIEAVRLHQNHHWPAKEVEVLVSTDGKKFMPLWATALRSDSAGHVDGPEDTPDPGPKNLTSIQIFDRPVKATHLRLRILSGYQPEHWGLDAVEVFGQGPRPIPETEPCSVSEEVTGLKPGTEVFYQLVAENEKGVSESEIKSLVLSTGAKPVIHEAGVIERTKNKVTINARVTAMGSMTELTGTLVNSKGKTIYEGSVSAGKWGTPLHVTLPLTGLTAKGKFKATLIAENESGKSAALTVTIGSA